MIVLTWDWKEAPQWAKLNTLLQGWVGPIVFNEVNTNSDSYAVVVANEELSKEQIKEVYLKYIQQ